LNREKCCQRHQKPYLRTILYRTQIHDKKMADVSKLILDAQNASAANSQKAWKLVADKCEELQNWEQHADATVHLYDIVVQ